MPESKSEISLAVWQFVRIMVDLEEQAARRGARPRIYDDWKGSWTEIDAALTELGAGDPKGFAQLMMDRDVRLPLEGADAVREVQASVARVRRALRGATGKPKDDKALETGLAFELRELGALAAELKTRATAPSNPRPPRGSRR